MAKPVIVLQVTLDDQGNIEESTQIVGVPTLAGINALTQKLQTLVQIIRSVPVQAMEKQDRC